MISTDEVFDFSTVPLWYALCTNEQCPLRSECLHYLAGSHAPDDMATALCIMPHNCRDGKCRFFASTQKIRMARGFSHLFDKVLKNDFTQMRKNLTFYLHGAKFYYQYMRGERALNPEQQQWIRQLVKDYGYDWEVPFDSYEEHYVYYRNW